MTRIQLPEINNFNAEQKEKYNRFPSNLIKAMATLAPVQTTAYLDLGVSFRKGLLSSKDREFVIVRVGYLSDSEYEIMQHMEIAKSTGLTDDDIIAIEKGDQSHFDSHLSTLMRFVDETVFRIQATDETFKDMQQEFSDPQIAEVLLLIGHYMMTARFLRGLDIDLDSNSTSWDNM